MREPLPRVRNDRNPVAIGPAPADGNKNAERLRTDIAAGRIGAGGGDGLTLDEVQELIDGYTPVTGGTGYVVGLPPGTPYVYVASNLAGNPSDLKAALAMEYQYLTSAALSQYAARGFLTEDTGNIFGYGTGTVACVVGTSINAFNPVTGQQGSIPINGAPSDIASVAFYSTYAVMCPVAGATTVRVYSSGGTWASFTPTAPSTGYTIRCVGIDASGTNICILWVNGSNLTQTITRTYSNTGTVVATGSVLAAGGDVTLARIENGYILASSDSTTASVNVNAYVRPADASTSAWKSFGFNGNKAHIASMCVSTSGKGFMVGQNSTTRVVDLIRFTYSTGTTALSASALTDQVFTGSTFGSNPTFGLAYINDTTVAVASKFVNTSSQATPFYGVVSIGATNVTISKLSFETALSDASNGAYSGAFAPLRLASGTIVFGVRNMNGSSTANNTASATKALLFAVTP